MTATTTPVTGTADLMSVPEPAGGPVRHGRLRDAAAVSAYLLAAVYVTSSLWTGLRDRVVAGYGTQDQILLEWFLGHAARSVVHLQNPLYSTQLNVPYGVNMMGNVSILGLGIPLAPVTLAFGPRVSFATLLVIALAGTASAWYFVLSRHLVRSRAAAFIGGAFCGFAPGMVSESLGHLQAVSLFLLPLIALLILRIRDRGWTWRSGVILGLLVAYQVFISEEMLFLTALAVSVYALVYALFRPSVFREVLGNLRPLAGRTAVAVAAAAIVLGYPLYRQFLGPQHYHGLPFAPSLIFVDLASYVSFPTNSLASGDTSALAHTTAEEGSFFGWPLTIVVLALAVWLWRCRDARARAATVCAVFFSSLSLGYAVVINGHPSGVPGPFRLIGRLPLFNLVVAARLALVVIPFIGILLALGYDRAAMRTADPSPTPEQAGSPGPRRWGLRRVVVLAAIVLAAIPIVPLPLPTVPVAAVPRFISDGTWRGYVPAGRTLVSVPTTSSFALDGMRWSSAADLEFAIPRGYFLGPGAGADRRPLYGAVPTWTSIILDQVMLTGVPYVKQPGDEQLLRADLRSWHAAVVVLSPKQAHAEALRTTLEQFLGPAQPVSDVLLWDVRTSTR
jgi:hypothetical protein